MRKCSTEGSATVFSVDKKSLVPGVHSLVLNFVSTRLEKWFKNCTIASLSKYYRNLSKTVPIPFQPLPKPY